MPCYHPYTAFKLEDGSIVFKDTGAGTPTSMPCGNCMGCRLERARQWAVRVMHEAKTTPGGPANCEFITLTYSDENYANPSLDYRDFQLFMKRLRKELKKPVRFFMCGEYGDLTRRKHFHAIIFGHRFADRKKWRKTSSGEYTYRSAQLEKLWPLGNSETGSVTYQSAQYISSYITKKITGDLAEQHYLFTHPSTGEIFRLTPEFCHMSLKPGIGYEWFKRYGQRVKNFDTVIVNGHEVKPPRYYDKLRRREDKLDIAEAKAQRELKSYQQAQKGETTAARLAVKETVKAAKLDNFKIRKGEL